MDRKISEVGIKQLKNQATQILREVRERGTEYTVTLEGVPVAVVRPISENKETRKARRMEALRRMDVLAREVCLAWKKPVSAADAVAEQRR